MGPAMDFSALKSLSVGGQARSLRHGGRSLDGGLELTLVMSSRRNSTGRIFLVLLACVIFTTGVANQASGSTPQSSASTRTDAPESMFSRGNHKGARLIVQRAANFGNDLFLNLSIDGREVANIAWNYRYDAFHPGWGSCANCVSHPKERRSSAKLNVCDHTTRTNLCIHRGLGIGPCCSPPGGSGKVRFSFEKLKHAFAEGPLTSRHCEDSVCHAPKHG